MKSERKFDCAIYSQNIKHRNNVRRHEKACCAGEKEKVEYTCKMCEKKCTREEFKTPFRCWKMKALFLRRKHFHTLFFRNNLHEIFLLPKKDFRKKEFLEICSIFKYVFYFLSLQLKLTANCVCWQKTYHFVIDSILPLFFTTFPE